MPSSRTAPARTTSPTPVPDRGEIALAAAGIRPAANAAPATSASQDTRRSSFLLSPTCQLSRGVRELCSDQQAGAEERRGERRLAPRDVDEGELEPKGAERPGKPSDEPCECW